MSKNGLEAESLCKWAPTQLMCLSSPSFCSPTASATGPHPSPAGTMPPSPCCPPPPSLSPHASSSLRISPPLLSSLPLRLFSSLFSPQIKAASSSAISGELVWRTQALRRPPLASHRLANLLRESLDPRAPQAAASTRLPRLRPNAARHQATPPATPMTRLRPLE